MLVGFALFLLSFLMFTGLLVAIGAVMPSAKEAGNGAAMRAGVLGVVFASDGESRQRWGRALAALTHRDERAIEGALFVAEVCARASTSRSASRAGWIREAASVLRDERLVAAAHEGLLLAERGVELDEAAELVGTTGYIVHSVALCSYAFVRGENEPALETLERVVRMGGDTDTHAAIVGGWIGAERGVGAWPPSFIANLDDGPFGPTHLRRLAGALAHGQPLPRWSWFHALARNLVLYPVVIGHGLLRVLPPW